MSAVRAYREDDFPALLALITGNAAPRHVVTASGLRFLLTAPEYRPETDLFVVPAASTQALVAARDIRITGRGDEPVLILESMEHAAPGASESIRASLLSAAEARARMVLREQGRQQGIVQTRSDADDAAAAALVEAAGMTAVRPLVSMRWPTVEGIPEPNLPTGITLRTYRPGEDDDAWVAAFNEAFADHWGGFMGMNRSRWRHYLQEDVFDPSISLVAIAGTEIAGFCHGRIDRELNRLNQEQVGMIRYVGVRPRWRGLGLGSALTRSGMIALRDAGMTSITLGVDAENVTGAHHLYERLGFAVVERQVIYRKPLSIASALGNENY